MVSGRGLGHTGGTLDKLEAIPGFCVDIEIDRYRQIARECGLVLVGQTARIAPADRVLDVKYGGGAFMVDRDDARALAISMTTIGRAMGKSVQTLLTSMEQPLAGRLATRLRSRSRLSVCGVMPPADLLEVSLRLAAEMLLMGNVASTHEEAIGR